MFCFICFIAEQIIHNSYVLVHFILPEYCCCCHVNKFFEGEQIQSVFISQNVGTLKIANMQNFCSGVYIFILDLKPGFNGLGKDSCKTRRKTFKFGDLMWLILEIWRYVVRIRFRHSNNWAYVLKNIERHTADTIVPWPNPIGR